MNNKAVIYARVSSREQEETGYSLSAQEKLLRDYAQRCNLQIVKVFSVTESASGIKQRVFFNEMMRFIESEGIAHLLCEKVDRLTRNLKEAVEANNWLDTDHERRIHFVKTSLVLHQGAKSDEKFRWDIEIVLAKKYIANLSEEVKKGQKEKISQGWLPTRPPLGYKTLGDKGHKIHVIDVDTAPFIRKMFKEYASGRHTIASITQMLADEGFRSRAGYKLVRSRIEALLKNPFYYGDLRWNNEIYKGSHEALITKELFTKVQDVMFGRNRNTGKMRTHKHLFKGMVKCKECGGAITWERQKGIVYGHCNQYRKCVKRPWYKEADFTAIIQAQLEEFRILTPRLSEWIKKALKHTHTVEIKERDSIVKTLQDRQNRLRQRQSMLYDDRLDGRIDAQFYDAKSNETARELDEVTEALRNQEKDDRRYYELGEALFELSQRAGDIFEDAVPEKQRRLLSLMCQGVYVEQGKLILHFTPEFEMLKALAVKLNSSKENEPVPSPYQIFELPKYGSGKGKASTFVPASPALLRDQGSNLEPTPYTYPNVTKRGGLYHHRF